MLVLLVPLDDFSEHNTAASIAPSHLRNEKCRRDVKCCNLLAHGRLVDEIHASH